MRYEFRAALNPPAEAEAEFVARCAEWMAGRLGAASNWRCWVAEEGGAIGGHLWLQLIEKVPNPAPERELHGYITNVYVRPELRGAGVGAGLLEAALAFCGDAGVEIRIANRGPLAPGFDLARVRGGVSGLALVRALLPRRHATLAIDAVGDEVHARVTLAPPVVRRLEPL